MCVPRIMFITVQPQWTRKDKSVTGKTGFRNAVSGADFSNGQTLQRGNYSGLENIGTAVVGR